MRTPLVLVIVGVVLLGLGSLLINVKVRRRWGAMNETTMLLSKGTGVVPSWISLMILVGWMALAVGVVWLLISIVS